MVKGQIFFCLWVQKKNDNLVNLIKKKSFFLFGPRCTGKSTLISQQLQEAKIYDLLDDEIFHKLARHPKILDEENLDANVLIVIDEIQKLPKVLDEVHRFIEKKGQRFLLTGSSARKLKRGGANMLGGRAWSADIFPLISAEMPDFDLHRYLNHGGLPHIYLSDDYKEELKSYVNLYLREEILSEALVRKYDYFLRFLDIIAQCNGQGINYERIGSDAGVPPRTVMNYVQILKDTLLIFELKPFKTRSGRKTVAHSKLFFFDIGVANHLLKTSEVIEGTDAFGKAFEQFIIGEIRAFLSYSRSEEELTYWRTTTGLEVDCIVGNLLAVEIKSTTMAQPHHLKGLRALASEKTVAKHVLVSRDSERRILEDGIVIYPWQEFLKDLWSSTLLIT